jgi:hypothetical protein
MIVFVAIGCGASSSEEARASKELEPKPPTAGQKAQMEDIKAQFPQAAPPGHS